MNMVEKESLERKTYLKTIEKLSVKHLAKLWNTFVKESLLYGEDSYIYDLSDLEDSKFLDEYMNGVQLKVVSDMVIKNGTCYVQWFNLNDNTIRAISEEDIKSTITAYWGEIFERIMLYPSCYNFGVELYYEGDASIYFDDVFFPLIVKEVGYIVDDDNGTIKKN